MKIISQVGEARDFLQQGKGVAYPTEAVYALGGLSQPSSIFDVRTGARLR